jgi:hypothetical protein
MTPSQDGDSRCLLLALSHDELGTKEIETRILTPLYLELKWG